MKKFSLMASLAALVTVGGVYATWNYAEKTAGEVEQHFTIGLETVTTTTKKGTISMTGALPLSIDNGGDYKAELIVASQNAQGLTVSFVPNVGSSVETIEMQIVVSVNDARFALTTDGESDVYMTADSTPITAAEVAGLDAVGSTGVLIPIDILMSRLDLTEVTLDTYQDYLDYESTLNQLSITVTASEVI